MYMTPHFSDGENRLPEGYDGTAFSPPDLPSGLELPTRPTEPERQPPAIPSSPPDNGFSRPAAPPPPPPPPGIFPGGEIKYSPGVAPGAVPPPPPPPPDGGDRGGFGFADRLAPWLSGIPGLSKIAGLFGGGKGAPIGERDQQGLFGGRFPLGAEELLLLGIAAFLFFSKSGDKICALFLIALLFFA